MALTHGGLIHERSKDNTRVLWYPIPVGEQVPDWTKPVALALDVLPGDTHYTLAEKAAAKLLDEYIGSLEPDNPAKAYSWKVRFDPCGIYSNSFWVVRYLEGLGGEVTLQHDLGAITVEDF